eukprot:SAG22_NODE_4981_length_1117_cov_0.912574_2_plen_76_part_00
MVGWRSNCTLQEVLEAGVVGFKLHEDWGTTPAVIDNALAFADLHDVAINIHTDTLNESVSSNGTVFLLRFHCLSI